jgi:WD40 repeat protein
MVASAAGDRTIKFWQPTIGRMVRYVRLDSVPLCVAWVDEDRIAASCVDGRIRIVDTNEVRVLRVLDGISGWAYCLAVHPSGDSMAVAGSDGQIQYIGLNSLTPANR